VGIDGKLAAELAALKLSLPPERKTPESLVLATCNGGPLSASNFLSRRLRPAPSKAKLPHVTFHSLRHTAATALRSAGVASGVAHKVLGHSSFATTQKLYGGVTAVALASAATAVADQYAPKPDKNLRNGSKSA
jgi:integrase